MTDSSKIARARVLYAQADGWDKNATAAERRNDSAGEQRARTKARELRTEARVLEESL